MHLLAYNSSKAALNAITLVYANALRDDGIRFNVVNPGLVATDLNGLDVGVGGARTPEAGAEVPVRIALTASDGPTGEFRGGDYNGTADDPVPW